MHVNFLLRMLGILMCIFATCTKSMIYRVSNVLYSKFYAWFFMDALLCSYFNLTETIAHSTLLPSSIIYYILACLHETLQLKNMINALFSSHDSGMKQFSVRGYSIWMESYRRNVCSGMFKKSNRACTYGTQIEEGPYTERLVDQVECTSC